MQTNFYTRSMQLLARTRYHRAIRLLMSGARYAFRYPTPCDSSESDAMWTALAGES